MIYTLDNWLGHEVDNPSLPKELQAQADMHESTLWFIDYASFEVEHESGCDWGDPSRDDYGSGPWSETRIVKRRFYKNGKFTKPEIEAELEASLLDEDGEGLMTIKLQGQDAVDFIGEHKLEEAAADKALGW